MLGRFFRRKIELDEDVVFVPDGLVNSLGGHTRVAPRIREPAKGFKPRAKVRDRVLDVQCWHDSPPISHSQPLIYVSPEPYRSRASQ